MVRTKEKYQVSNPAFYPADKGMTFEVRVYRHGDLLHREQCDSMEQAWLVIDEWAEMGDVSCEVGDLLVRRRGEE